jgi:hypothetical protein
MSTPSAPVISNAPLASPNTLEYWWYPPVSGAPIQDYYLTLTSQYGTLNCNVGSAETYYKVTGLSNAETYFTTISASNANGLGIATSFREFQPGSPPPRGVSTLSAVAVTVSTGAALVSWTPPFGYPPVPDATIFWYVISGFTTSNALTPVVKYTAGGLTQSNYFIPGLNSTISYYFTVRAVNCPGWSVPLSTNTISWVTPIPAFAPTMTAGLDLWLDASVAATIGLVGGSTSNINTWSDRTSNNSAATTPTIKPYLNFSNLNNLNTINMSNFASSPNWDYFLVNNNYNTTFLTYVLLARVYSPSDGGYGIISTDTPSRYGRGIGFNTSGATNTYQIISDDQFTSTAIPTPIGNWAVLSLVFNNTGSVPFGVNGSNNTVSVGTGTPDNTTGLKIGLWNINDGSIRNTSMDIAETTVYTSALTPFNTQKVEGYMAWKWGIQSNLSLIHPFRSTRPMSNSVFAPPMLSSLQLWLDAQDISTFTFTSGDKITQMNDKSGNGRNATPFDNSPIYSATALNNYPAVQMAPVSTLRAPMASGVTNLGMSVFVVFQKTGAVSAVADTLVTRGTNNLAGPIDMQTSATNNLRYRGNGATQTSIAANFSLRTATSPTLFNFYAAPSAWQEWVNGTISLNSATAASYADPAGVQYFFIGARADKFTEFRGNIGEVLLYNRDLSSQDRQTVEGYLAWKWGLQGNLATTHPYRYNNPGIVNFTQISPSTFGGLQMWLDASQLTGLSNGGTLTTWTDRSSNAYVGTAVASPTFITNSMNGLPIVRFNGSTQYINFGSNILNIGSNSGVAFFAVVKYNTSGNGGIGGKTVYGPGEGRWALNRDTNTMRFIIQADGTAPEATYSDTSTTPQLAEGLWNRQVQYIFQNGAQGGSNIRASSTNLSNSFPLYIGAYSSASPPTPQAGFYLNGDIAEVLVYMSNITPFIRQQIEGYLTWKWGLQASLPTSHPYFTAPPQQAYTVFNPLLLPNLQLWLDASDATTFSFSSGSNISQWRDKSGRLNNANLTSGIVRRSTDGGLTVVDTTATGYLTTAVASLYSANLTICVAVLRTTSTAFQMAMGSGGRRISYGLNASIMCVQGGPSPSSADDGGQLGGNSYNVNGSRNTLISTTLPNYHILSFTFVPNGTNISIGTNFGASQFYGYFAEIIVFNPNTNSGTPYTDQRQTVEGYLAWKWGLQGLLPVTHPYASVNPGV